jgi:hypothetical protein
MPSIPYEEFLRVGFPKINNSGNEDVLEYEYVGPESALPEPKAGEQWGDLPYRVKSASLEKQGILGQVLLRVTAAVTFEETPGISIVTDVSYELEWVLVRRPLQEHPAFSAGGAKALTDTDLLDIQYWREADYADKILFKFRDESETLHALSANATIFAKYLLRGVEGYDDRAPVARRIKTYAGGPPKIAEAGAKTTIFPAFPNKPTGEWEWLKTADRGLRAAGTRDWQQSEELTGASKVLIDNRNLYLT